MITFRHITPKHHPHHEDELHAHLNQSDAKESLCYAIQPPKPNALRLSRSTSSRKTNLRSGTHMSCMNAEERTYTLPHGQPEERHACTSPKADVPPRWCRVKLDGGQPCDVCWHHTPTTWAKLSPITFTSLSPSCSLSALQTLMRVGSSFQFHYCPHSS